MVHIVSVVSNEYGTVICCENTRIWISIYFFKIVFIYLTEKAQAAGAAGRGRVRGRLHAEQEA